MQEVVPTTTQPLSRSRIEIKQPPVETGKPCVGLPSDAKEPIEDGPLPSAESLKAARRLLLAEYGPCVACHTQTLVATARRIEASLNSA
ncbi:MAG: hypothetical protein O3A19_06490 [Planctomycetota bacterium]|jgi:hypothetical protein|nr:hypothetical protein [Planctomycetota bacterium]MDA1026061.1 hypothetical protein [Planctomycetota bacterium]